MKSVLCKQAAMLLESVKFTGEITTVKLRVTNTSAAGTIEGLPKRKDEKRAVYSYTGLEVLIVNTQPKAVHLGREPINLALAEGNAEWDYPEKIEFTVKCGALPMNASIALLRLIGREVEVAIRADEGVEGEADQGMFEPPAPLHEEQSDEEGDSEK